VNPAGLMLKLEAVRFGYESSSTFLGPISLTIDHGQCWAIVGPNGAGKSTLIRLMAGLLSPREGTLLLNGKSVTALSLRHRARRISFLPQQPPDAGDFTVRDVVLMGRYPHRSLGLFDSAADQQLADEAMRRTGVFEFAERTLGSLSGGEAQRVHLAAVLAQQAELMILDEPTASLDIKHQLAVFKIIQRVLQSSGASAVVVMHDINLAAMFCSHIALVHEGRLIAAGPADGVLTAQRVQDVYGVELAAVPVPYSGRTWLVPRLDTQQGSSSLP